MRKRRGTLAAVKPRRRKKAKRMRAKRRVIIKVVTTAEPSRLAAIRSGNLANGVNLIGFTREEMGIGEASRSTAKALESAQIPFGIIHFPMPINARGEDLSWRHKEMSLAPYKVNLFHMNADTLLSAPGYFGHEMFRDHFNIGYWAWELAEFPEEWTGAFSLVDEIWVPSTFIMDAVSQKSPVPVIRIPHSIRTVSEHASRGKFGLPENKFLFLCMFDTHSLSERKNPQAAIDAFKTAFHPDDQSVGLVIKVNNAQTFPLELQKIADQTRDFGNIYLFPDIMSRPQVNALIQATDCFVS
ncbi:MAG TPA: glycosyltransferase family 1 protein, partial [Bacilli bacterium]